MKNTPQSETSPSPESTADSSVEWHDIGTDQSIPTVDQLVAAFRQLPPEDQRRFRRIITALDAD